MTRGSLTNMLARALTLALAVGAPAHALGPTVVPTSEGDIGELPDTGERMLGIKIESIRGGMDLIFGGLSAPPAPDLPNFEFLTDAIHGTPNPQQLLTLPATFNDVIDQGPTGSGRVRNAADDGDFVAFGFTSDGAAPGTMTIRVSTFDDTGSELSTVTLDDLPTFPDPSLNDVGVAVDDQGRVTVAYTELPPALPARVVAQRFDGLTGLPLGGTLPIVENGRAATDVALLDPAGDRLLIPTSDFATIRGNVLDTTGPMVLPDFPISTTPALFANLNTSVASDPESGVAIVAWENLSGQQGDPVNIYARRFDADGNPVGTDFRVNTTTANAQGQPATAVGPGGISAVAWAGDAAVAGDELDVFLQTYDAEGNPIGGETRVNTTTAEVQDRPAVRFLPEPDNQGRPQVIVTWRDVGSPDGSQPNGTGSRYKCFSIEGLSDPPEIFADGFESGDTSSWSTTTD